MSSPKILQLISFNGIGLNVPGVRSAVLNLNEGGHNTPEHSGVSSSRLGRFPKRVREQPNEKTLPLRFTFAGCDHEGQFWALSRIFDPTLGPRILLMRDGHLVYKQVTGVPTGIVNDGSGPQDDTEWVVPLLAARGVLETPTETIISNDLVSAVAVNYSPNNIGTYFAQPIIEIEPIVRKNASQAWTKVREVTYSNRAEFPLTGPAADAWLIELTNGGWDTAAVITGTQRAQLNGAIDAVVTSIPYDTGINGFLPVAGAAMIGTEQITWTAGGGAVSGTLTGVVRGAGGTTAASHADNAAIFNSEMMADGRDIAVFIDEVQVPDAQVYINAINSAATRIWVKISDGPAIVGTLRDAVSVGASTFTLTRADHGFAVGDFIVWNDSGSAKQMALIQAIDRNELTVQRTVRATPNANSTAADTKVYRAGRHFQIAHYWTLAPARPTLEDVPLIDLNTSSNLLWEWNLGPFWAEANRKPGGFRRILYPGREDVPIFRQNRLAFKTSLTTVAGQAAFLDEEPVATAPNFDALEFASPVGIDNVAGAIEYDAILDYPFVLQIIGRDFLGIEHLIASRFGHESGDSHEPPVTYTNQTETPARPLAAVIFRARNIIVTGRHTGDTDEDVGLGAVNTDSQDFVLDAATRLDGFVVRLRRPVNVNAELFVTDDSADAGAPGLPILSAYVHTLTGAGPLEVCFHEALGFVAVAAGTYHVIVRQASGTIGDLKWMKASRSLFARGAHWEHDGSVVTYPASAYVRNADEDMWFYVLSESADNQEDVVDRTGEAVVLDNIKITFDPDRTMIVDPRPSEDAYYIHTTLTRGDEEVELRYLKRWADNAEIEIDTLEKSLEEKGFGLNIRHVLTSRDDDWLLVPTGPNTIAVQAPEGATQETVRLKYRDTWQG